MDVRGSADASQIKETLRGSITSVGASVSDTVAHSRDAVGAAARDAVGAAANDLQALRIDLGRLKDTVSTFMTQVSHETTKSAREVSFNVAGRVGGAADDFARKGTQMASNVSEQASSFVFEFESAVRRNPMPAVAGAVMAGVLLGLIGRRRV